MSQTVMRNRVTGEYTTVEKDGPEFWDLRGRLDAGDGRPVWEQTGEHDLAARQKRERAGSLRPEDIGDKDQPIQKTFGDPLADNHPGLDRGYPTPGEIEQGAGRAANMSDEDLKEARASLGIDAHGSGYPAGKPPTRQDEDGNAVESDKAIGGATIPVSDETPSIIGADGRTGDLNDDGDKDDPYEGLLKEDLASDCEDRNLEVVRLDGRTDLEPRAEDYLAALRKADESESESEESTS